MPELVQEFGQPFSPRGSSILKGRAQFPKQIAGLSVSEPRLDTGSLTVVILRRRVGQLAAEHNLAF
jgi:hypothetical protein